MTKSEQLTISLIIEIIYQLYGYDFRHYSAASLRRRLLFHQSKKNLADMADMIPYLLNDPNYFDELLSDLSVTVTEMFRDPYFYKAFKTRVIPKLKTYPYIKMWDAGCSTGEEVYSIAILLYENQYLDKTQIYATDFNPYAIETAKRGIYPLDNKKKYEDNYKSYGGEKTLSDYFIEKYKSIKIKGHLQKKITFHKHNLATDNKFGDMEVIICRNVMIYFDSNLKERTLNLFFDSLVPYGFLCLGDKESLDVSEFKCIDKAASIYQKVP